MIKKAEFVMSNSQVSKCPKENLPEYAFIGRSNVGKSSLINMLTNHKNLAKTSGRPGKTQLINHFKIDNSWFLVDLPGYGYARVSKETRHEPQKIDVEFMQWLGEHGIPFAIVFTKADKLKPLAIERNIAAYQQVLLETWEEFPPYFITSAENKTGKEELTHYIEQINEEIKNKR